MLFDRGKSWPRPLVSARWLEAHLRDRHLRVLDVREFFGQAIAGYPWGHIPGALSTSPDAFFTLGSAHRRLLSRDELEPALRTLGLSSDVSIVVYDETTGTLATLAFWALLALGFERVGVLDGGWQGWLRQGGPVEKDLPKFPKPGFSPTAVGGRMMADEEYVAGAVERGGARFVDARTPDEFSEGHIPGAISWPWRENVSRDADSEWLKPISALKRRSEELGLSPEAEVICYCNAGVQASHVCFVLHLLGFRHVRLYPGSWRGHGL